MNTISAAPQMMTPMIPGKSQLITARPTGKKPLVTAICLLTALLLIGGAGLKQAGAAEDFYALRQQLKKDGFDAARIDDYYGSPRVKFEQEAIARFFHHSEARLDYGQFLTAESIRQAEEYTRRHLSWMEKAETAFKVDKEIIAAILLVETRCGRFVGKAVTLNILSSMAALADPALRKKFWQAISADSNLSREEFRQKAAGKSAWAYKELKAFLTYVDRENLSDPLAITGSYAGALGIPQFMPSNILALGVDGNNDGKTDLFSHADAIMSVARYLNYHGWKPGLNQEQAHQVLRRYNNSSYYADTLLKIRQRLKE